MNKKTLLSALFLCLSMTASKAQENSSKQKTNAIANTKKMEWFKDAKLGIFIHWGVYSVKGISESWAFFNNYISHDNYMKQLDGFNASKYKPEEWVKLIKESGAKYSVITTKHHDGVSLWDTKAPNATTTLKHSAAKKDLIAPFVKALKASGLKTGLYFSLPDWSYGDYDGFTREHKRYQLEAEPKRWDTFCSYYQQQLNELSANFKPDLIWFDGDWEHNSQEWQVQKVLKNLRSYNSDIIINSRLNNHGDYETPEQGIPVVQPVADYWELCYTINDSWGYQPYDNKYKSPNMIIRTLVDCISMGGNLLLDIGPKADGTIPEQQIAVLKGLARWTSKHGEAIYGTRAGIPADHFNGKTSLSKDKKTLYLYADWAPYGGVYNLTGLLSEVKSARIVGSSQLLSIKKNGDNLSLRIPQNAADQDVTVMALEFKEPIRLAEKTTSTVSLRPQKELSDKQQIAQFTAAIHDGNNPFGNTKLTVDGLGLEAEKKTLSPEIYNWITKNSESLYKTTKGLPEGHYQGKSALSADKQTLFLFVEGKPTGPIALKGVKNKISRIRIVGEGTMIEPEIYNKLYWSAVPGIVYIPVPEDRLDKSLTVIAVLLDSPVELHREKVTAVESNL